MIDIFVTSLKVIKEAIPIIEKISTVINAKKRQRLQQKQELQIALDKFWYIVDNLTPSDRKALRNFVETNNEPVECRSATWHSPTSLFSSEWVNKTDIGMSNEKLEKLNDKPFNPICASNIHCITQYKLKTEIYLFAKYSLDNFERICHFE